jgi:phospholipid/cholesterol/gamma-HCH transport system substrate-binding protein
MGFVVLAFAALMLTYALGVSGLRQAAGGAYEVTARFGEAGGIQPGARSPFRGQGGFGLGCDH